jgi:hypothetical protein
LKGDETVVHWISHVTFEKMPLNAQMSISSFPYVFVFISWGGVRLGPLFGLLCQPWMIDDDGWGAVDGMKIGRGN